MSEIAACVSRRAGLAADPPPLGCAPLLSPPPLPQRYQASSQGWLKLLTNGNLNPTSSFQAPRIYVPCEQPARRACLHACRDACLSLRERQACRLIQSCPPAPNPVSAVTVYWFWCDVHGLADAEGNSPRTLRLTAAAGPDGAQQTWDVVLLRTDDGRCLMAGREQLVPA